MSKGKKFDAAEKHFAKEREQLMRENRKLREELSNHSMLIAQLSTLEKQVAELEAEKQLLLKKLNMTDADIAREKRAHLAIDLLLAMKGATSNENPI